MLIQIIGQVVGIIATIITFNHLGEGQRELAGFGFPELSVLVMEAVFATVIFPLSNDPPVT